VHWRYSIELLNVPPRGTALVGLALLDNGLVASIDGGVGVVQSLRPTDVPTGHVVRMWDLSNGNEVGSIETSDYGLPDADVILWDRRAGRLIVGSTMYPNRQLEIDPQTGRVRIIDAYNVFLLADEQYGADHPDGLLRAEATQAEDVRVVDVADFGNTVTLQSAGPGLAFTPDGHLLLTSGPSGAIRLWGVPSIIPAAD
jgi:WD40 repeat protein